MQILEVETELSPEEVVERARTFFTTRFTPYAGFIEAEGPSHIRFRVEAGSLAIGVGTREGRRVVRGSTSRLHRELAQFLAGLDRPEGVRQNLLGAGSSRAS